MTSREASAKLHAALARPSYRRERGGTPAAGWRRSRKPILPPAAPPRIFALCADDYALSAGVSRGILEALDAGAITATSAMTNSPRWPGDAAALRRHAGAADIGLHLTLTCGRPLTAMPCLAPSGMLPPLAECLRRARRNALPAQEIEAEIEAQLDAFAQSFGHPPDHIDGHQHVHVLQAVRRPLLKSLQRRGWTPWLRDSGDALGRIVARRAAVAKALALTWLGRTLPTEAGAAGFGSNDGFAGFSRFDPAERYADLFARYLVAPGPRHLVMCHPGYADDELRRLDPVVETREQELRFLLSPALPALLERRRFALSRLPRRVGPIA